jgi:putative oxidoreductase
MQMIEKLYGVLIQAASSLQSPFLLLIRLYWGWQFMQTGWGKLHDISKVIGYFTDLGIPAPAFNAYFVSGLEFVGGILLMVGLASRPIALMCVIDMIVAFVKGDLDNLKLIFADPDKFQGAAPYQFLFAFLIVLIFGPGLFSLDALIDRMRHKREPTA